MENIRQIKKWSKDEISKIIDYLKDNINLEQPTAQIYYKKLLEKTCISATWDLVKWKLRHLKNTFIKAQDWKNSTGAGLLQEDEEAGTCSVEAKIQKICPYYGDLKHIFGKTVTASCNFDSETIGDIIILENVQIAEPVPIAETDDDLECRTSATPNFNDDVPIINDNGLTMPDHRARKNTFRKNLKPPVPKDALSVLAQAQEGRNANMRIRLETE